VDLVALRLAKAGYYGGDPGRVKSAPVGDVLNALAYEGFIGEYEAVEYEMNKA
jgi:hypothetical protein